MLDSIPVAGHYENVTENYAEKSNHTETSLKPH